MYRAEASGVALPAMTVSFFGGAATVITSPPGREFRGTQLRQKVFSCYSEVTTFARCPSRGDSALIQDHPLPECRQLVTLSRKRSEMESNLLRPSRFGARLGVSDSCKHRICRTQRLNTLGLHCRKPCHPSAV